MIMSNPFSGRNEAVSRLGGLEDLYTKYVKRFQINYSDSHTVLSGLVHQRRYEEAKTYAHSLKGLTATLGMQNLHSCCEDIEFAIKEGRFSDLAPFLRSYEYALYQVVQSNVDQNPSLQGGWFSTLE